MSLFGNCIFRHPFGMALATHSDLWEAPRKSCRPRTLFYYCEQSFFIVLLVGGADPGSCPMASSSSSSFSFLFRFHFQLFAWLGRKGGESWQVLLQPRRTLDIYLLCAGHKRKIYCGMSFKVQTFSWLLSLGPLAPCPAAGVSFFLSLVLFFILFLFFFFVLRDIFTCVPSRAGLTVSMHAKWRSCRCRCRDYPAPSPPRPGSPPFHLPATSLYSFWYSTWQRVLFFVLKCIINIFI